MEETSQSFGNKVLGRLAAEPGTDRSFDELANSPGNARWHCAQDLRPWALTLRLRLASGNAVTARLQRFAYKNERAFFPPRVRVAAIPNSEVRPSSAVTTVTHYASRREA